MIAWIARRTRTSARTPVTRWAAPNLAQWIAVGLLGCYVINAACIIEPSDDDPDWASIDSTGPPAAAGGAGGGDLNATAGAGGRESGKGGEGIAGAAAGGGGAGGIGGAGGAGGAG